MKANPIVGMLQNYWLERGVSVVLLLVFLFLAYLSFGHPLYFDRLFIIVLIALLTTVRMNKELLSTLLGLLFVRSMDELAFVSSGIPHAKLIFYALSLFIIVKLRHDLLTRWFIAPIYLVSLGAEAYWYFSDYKAPSIHTYFLLLAINSGFRHFLIAKQHDNLFGSCNATENSIRYRLYRLAGFSNVVVGTLIIEYLIRHLSYVKPMFVYDLYSYIMHLVSLALFYFVAESVIKSKSKFSA